MPGTKVAAESGTIKPAVFRFWIALGISGGLGLGALRGDGIALSRDGEHWLPGAGAYGEGWGDVGETLRVEAGSSIYLRYFAGANSRLYYAPHGAQDGPWKEIGPIPTTSVGAQLENPIILKLTEIGTPKSNVQWVNGEGIWAALTSPGVYDFALHPMAKWTTPPLTVIEREKRGWWAALLNPLRTSDGNDTGVISLSDAGATSVLLGIAILTIFGARKALTYRRRPPSCRDERLG